MAIATGFEWWDKPARETGADFRTAVLEALRTHTCAYQETKCEPVVDEAAIMLATHIASALDEAARVTIHQFENIDSPEGDDLWKHARSEFLSHLRWAP